MSETEKRLTLYPPVNDKVSRKMDRIRKELIHLGEFLEEELPQGRELSLALTKLEELTFFSIAAIARNQETVEVDE